MTAFRTALPEEDVQWRRVESTMRRHGFEANALIESLHAVQETYGYLDEESLRRVAEALRLPLSRVYGVATFYHYFTLKPKGKHTCVICMGTACYIKGAAALADTVRDAFDVGDEGVSADGELSLLSARCVGACGIAPAVSLDGRILGRVGPDQLAQAVRGALDES